MVRRNRGRERRVAAALVVDAPLRVTDAIPGPPRHTLAAITTDAALDLASRLLDPARHWPVVVVTTRGRALPFVDPQAVLDEVCGAAEVVVLSAGDTSWAFAQALPARTQVYGGGVRVYPAATDWLDNPSRSRLRLADAPDVDGELAQAVAHDVRLALAAHRPDAGSGTAGPAGGHPVEGTVQGVVGERGLVRLEDGSTATVWPDTTLPGEPLGGLLRAGQRVRGTLDPRSRRLDLGDLLPDPPAARRRVRAAYPVGSLVVGRVEDVSADAVLVELLPRLHVRVPRVRITDDERTPLPDLFTVGEVVVGRVVAAPGGIGLVLDDIDESRDGPRESVLQAIAVLEGGPPWLTPPGAPAPSSTPLTGDRAPEAPAVPAAPDAGPPASTPGATVPALSASPRTTRAGRPACSPTPADLAAHVAGHRPAPLPPGAAPAAADRDDSADTGGAPRGAALQGASLALETARHRVAALEDTLDTERSAARDLETECDGLRQENEHLRLELASRHRTVEHLRSTHRRADNQRQQAERALRAVQRSDDVPDDSALFADPADQLRFEVSLAWARLVLPAEKAHKVLAPFDVGPAFVASLDTIEGVTRRKVLEVLVRILTGDAASLNGLDVHPLRAGSGGDDPIRTRADGGVCYRVALQRSSPAARRLHYWKTPDGMFELSRVVVHDDTEP